MIDMQIDEHGTGDGRRGSGGDISELPEDCLANVLSLTSPLDACRLSAVSSSFKSAAEWDAVWERFLPADYPSLIANSSDPSLLARFSSRKNLFFSLCGNPVLIDNGTKSFWLDKSTGKKCYMLSARNLSIVWGDTPAYWRWINEPNSRFAEVAELVSVCWLEICCKISISMLSPATLYKVCLVFKTTAVYGFEHQPIEVIVGLVGSEGCKRTLYLNAEREQRPHYLRTRTFRGGFFPRARNWMPLGLLPYREREDRVEETTGEPPILRGDGWLEIELGEFFNEDGESGELAVSVLEVKGGHWKGGLIVQGIELRPKVTNQ